MQKSNINPAILQQVLESATNSAEKGLSQFFTPAAFAAWCAQPLPVHRPVIVDLNCGAGALLHASALKDTKVLLGSDIDPCRSTPKSETSDPRPDLHVSRITHDVTLLYSKLKEIQFTADLFVLNPPWRLFWHRDRFADFANSDLDAVRDAYAATEPGTPDGTLDSTIATLAMALDLCTTYGEGFLIANNNTLQRLLFNPGAPYAMLARHLWVHIIIAGNPMTGLNDCKWVKSDDGQSGTDFKTGVIYFAASHENGPQHYEVPVSTFCFPLSALPANPADRTARMGSEMRNAYYANDEILELWQVVKETIAEEAGKTVKVPWNLWLDVGRHIRTALSRFEEKSVKTNKREAERLFNLNGKTPMELVLQRAERDNLLHVLDQGGWKVQPELRAAVEGAIQQYHAARAPLYPLPDIQRLGYLDEQDTIVCKADLTLYRETKPHTIKTEDGYHTILDGDGEEMSGFDDIKEARAELKKLNTALPPPVQLIYRAGQKYSLRTQTVQITRKTMKPNSFNGELEELEFTGQELAIFIADKVRDPDNEKEELTEYCFMDGKLRDDNTTIAEARQQKNRRRRRWEREPDAVPIDFTLQELADHFIIPDVPDVAANNPEGYQANLDKLNDVEQLANALIA
jgi:predicted RNA methylase